MIEFSNWKKIVGTILGTLILGAIGSGLWEIALKPLAQWLGTAILTIATLGSTAIKDDNFREAAKGLHEASSLQLLWLVFFGLSTLTAGSHGYLMGRRSADKEGPKRNSDVELKRFRQESYRYRLVAVGLVFLVTCFVLISYLKLLQANNAYTFFEQSMTICRPYLDDQQARILESRFASITGRGDYIAITDELRKIAASNHRKLPDFKPW